MDCDFFHSKVLHCKNTLGNTILGNRVLLQTDCRSLSGVLALRPNRAAHAQPHGSSVAVAQSSANPESNSGTDRAADVRANPEPA